MNLFTSNNERKLWFWTIAVVVAIFATLGLAGTLATELIERELAEVLWIWGLSITSAAVVGVAIARRKRWLEIWIGIGVFAVYGMALPRAGFDAAERSHLFEYGLVATLIFQALRERYSTRPRPYFIAVLAMAISSTIGLIDELIQPLFPNRGFEIVDVGFNAFAAFVVVLGNLLVWWIRDLRTR